MDGIEHIVNYFQIQEPEILVRVLFSIILGSVIGIEREITNKSAGLRTQILVCLGSCIFTILSIYGFSTAVTLYPIGDPARVAAQIITGIGFIGAGTVLRQGFTVMGLTTASTLWIGAAIGMACGCGRISLAVVSTVLAFAVLVFIRMFEYKFLPGSQKHLKKIKISFLCKEEDYDKIYNDLTTEFIDIIEFTKKLTEEEKYSVKVSLKIISPEKNPVIQINNLLSKMSLIHDLTVKELFE